MNKVREALQWLGIKDVRPLTERVYARMVLIAKKHKRPVAPMDLRELCDGNRLNHALRSLREQGRVQQLAKGKWIPLP